MKTRSKEYKQRLSNRKPVARRRSTSEQKLIDSALETAMGLVVDMKDDSSQ